MSQLSLDLAKSIYRSQVEPDRFVLTEDQFESLFQQNATISGNAATTRTIPLAASADKSLDLVKQMSTMRFEELSAYFSALCSGEISPKFLPYSGRLPNSLIQMVSFKGNPYPRTLSQSVLSPIHARVLDPHFAEQKQGSGLAYEYNNLVNTISHLYDVAFIFAALDSCGDLYVHTGSNQVKVSNQLQLCLAIVFTVLSWCDKRAFEVKNINSSDPDKSSVAMDYFKKYHLLTPEQQGRPSSEHALGLQRALSKHAFSKFTSRGRGQSARGGFSARRGRRGPWRGASQRTSHPPASQASAAAPGYLPQYTRGQDPTPQ